MIAKTIPDSGFFSCARRAAGMDLAHNLPVQILASFGQFMSWVCIVTRAKSLGSSTNVVTLIIKVVTCIPKVVTKMEDVVTSATEVVTLVV